MSNERIGEMTGAQIREFEARTTLARAGFRPDATRRFPLAMLEALAGVVDEWGQDAGYPDEMAGYGLLAPEGKR